MKDLILNESGTFIPSELEDGWYMNKADDGDSVVFIYKGWYSAVKLFKGEELDPVVKKRLKEVVMEKVK